MTTLSLVELHEQAVKLAQQAETDYIAKHGEPAYCGFAWVKLYIDGRKPATKALVKAGYANKGWDGGYVVWNPAGNGTQSMDVKEIGAQVYAEFMREAGIKAYAGSRAD